MHPACASACSAARSIRRTRRIVPRRCLPCGGSVSTGCGGSSRPAIRSRIHMGLLRSASGRRRAGACAPSPHRRHRLRSRSRHQLHLCNAQLSGPALQRRPFRLDHGRRQSAPLPSLAALARHRAAGADRGRRSAGAEPLFGRQCQPARRWRCARLPESAAKTLPQRKPPAWVYLHGLKSPLSSTALAGEAEALNDSCLTAKELKLLTRRAYLEGEPRIRWLGASENGAKG